MSSRYELLIIESVWLANVERDVICVCNVHLRSEP